MDFPTFGEVYQHFAAQYQNNQFMQAAIVAAPVTALTYAARNFPSRIWGTIKRLTTLEISFNSDIPAYTEIADLVTTEIVNDTFSRRYNFNATEKWDHTEDERVIESKGLQVGYGKHWGTYKRTPVIVNRSLDEGNQTAKFKERIEVTFLTRNRNKVVEFSKMLQAEISKTRQRDVVNVYLNNGDYWSRNTRLPKRRMGTVITANNIGQQLVDHVRKFESDKARYRELGLPWHTGAILKGPPGTGKTSLIHAVASELDRSIHYLNLGSLNGDASLSSLMSGMTDWTSTLLVIEDADATGISKSRSKPQRGGDGSVSGITSTSSDEEHPPVTLSTLLNILDGLMTPDGLVVIATTNHPEKLDPAMMRSGRFDLDLTIDPLPWEQFVEMAELFGEAEGIEMVKPFYKPTPGANLRAILLKGGLSSITDHFIESPQIH